MRVTAYYPSPFAVARYSQLSSLSYLRPKGARAVAQSRGELGRAMASRAVVFEPGGIEVAAEDGERLIDVAARAQIRIRADCGGQGVCGTCRVVVESGTVEPLESEEAMVAADGGVLACQALVAGDAVVRVPELTAVGEIPALSEAQLPEPVVEKFLRIELPGPLARRIELSLPPPTETDTEADFERLRRGMVVQCPDCTPLTIALACLRQLPTALRDSDFEIVATSGDFRTVEHVIDLAPPPARPAYGLAIDVGTSTVVVQAVDLETSRGRAISSRNAQVRYGDDVINRIVWSQERPQGLQQLREAIIDLLNLLIGDLREQEGIELEDIIAASVAGNSTMMNFLLGIDARPIRRSPHIPPITLPPVLTAREVGLQIHPEAPLSLSPAVSGFVGGDISAGVLATGMADSEEVSLLVDIGTNGEMVLGNREWLSCASCSAGPAFEGVGIECATFAVPGAIGGYEYDAEADEAHVSVIGDRPPLGICGTGLVEALASLAGAGAIDRGGRINLKFPSSRVQDAATGPEFVLVREGEAGAPAELRLKQTDIENLIRSKAAVHAGITVLLEQLGLQADDIQHLHLAGAFGNYLNVETAVAIGMLPDLPRERIQFVGNTSLAGAYLALLSREARKRLVEIAEGMTYLELGDEPSFTEEFVASMFIPHTDIAQFPSLMAGNGQ